MIGRGLLTKAVPGAAMALVGAFVVAGCRSSDSGQDPLTVGAASSLRTALADYQGQDDALAPVRVSFAGSDLIASQIRQGAGIDVIAAASATGPAALYEDGLVDKPVPYAGNEVVIGVPADSDVDSIDDLAAPGVKLVIGDDAVPVGNYTREILDRLPTATGEAIEENVKSEEPDVAGIAAKLVQGAADAGFVYATDVLSAPEEIKAIPIPDRLQPTITYSAAVTRDSDQAGEASAYIEGLLSGEGAEDLKESGFLPAP